MRTAFKGIGLIVALLIAAYSYLLIRNNQSMTSPPDEAIQTAFAKSVDWLEAHRQKVLADSNPVLWYMIQRAADISKNKRLATLFAEYEQRYLKNDHRNLWRGLFYPGSWVPVRFEDIASYPYYNQHFIYALLCDKDLEKIPSIAAQNEADFCDSHPLRPACVTHQLMGLQMLQNSHCGDSEKLAATIKALQARIARQLYFDPRVVDIYMQRVLMLVDTGAAERVKSAWIQHLLDAQQEDGGWSSFEGLVPVGDGRYFGYETFFGVKKPVSSFHMTAQGVLLFALLGQ